MSLRNCAAVSPSHSNGPSERPSRLIWLWRHGPMTRKLFPILPFAFSASQLVIAPYMSSWSHSPCSHSVGTFEGLAATSLSSACRSEEHTSELQSLMRISYAVFCLKKKNQQDNT